MIRFRVNGTQPLMRLRGEMDRLFEDVLERTPFGDVFDVFGGRVFPAVNVWEDGDALYAEAELPGVTMEDLSVSVLGDELTIRGERKDPRAEEFTYHRRERGVGAFTRVLHLPVPVNADKVSAALHDGVLTITLPKAETAKPRKIQVKA